LREWIGAACRPSRVEQRMTEFVLKLLLKQQIRIVAAAGGSRDRLRIDRTGLVGIEDLAEIVIEVATVENL
jgi:hypothetical protein